jgi:cardiolipin synthase
MHETTKKILTIPNIISFLRILMIPIFSWCYLADHRVATLVLITLSGISDKIDGAIARKLGQVSDTGKWLDPTADKLTQITLAVLLFIKFHASGDIWMVRFSWVFLLFLGKELLMLLFGLLVLALGQRPAAAEIWGKAATVVFYIVMGLLFLAGPVVGVLAPWWALPPLAVQIMVIVNLVLTFVAFFSYLPDTYRKLFCRKKNGTAR